MITNFFKNGLSLDSLSISNKNPTPQKQSITPQEYEKIFDEILVYLTQILNDKLGEKIEESQVRVIASDIKQSKILQSSLIESKQKYNQLVNKSTNLYQHARKISNSVGQFITSINLFFDSQELLIPLKQIQKGINELQSERVEKQINYLIKIFQTNFQDTLDKKVKKCEENANEELKMMRNTNKMLENELNLIKSTKNNDQSKFLEQAMKISTNSEKITKLNAQKLQLQRQIKQSQNIVSEKSRIISQQSRDLQRIKQRQNQHLQKIKQLQSKIIRLDRQVKQNGNIQQNMNSLIQKLKENQDEIVQQMEAQFKKKQMVHESIRKKLSLEKAVLQQTIVQMKQKLADNEVELKKKQQLIVNLQQRLQKLKQSSLVEFEIEMGKEDDLQKKVDSSIGSLDNLEQPGTKKTKVTLNDLVKSITRLEKQNKVLKDTLENMEVQSVNRQVFKNLFLNYDDESKQWSTRRNIKNQIYTLLSIQDKLPKAEQAKQGKWFGIF